MLRISNSFWSYELSKRALTDSAKGEKPEWMSVLLCGGIAGVVTWASIFPLGIYFLFCFSFRSIDANPSRIKDVIKTRLQTQDISAASPPTTPSERSDLLERTQSRRLTSVQIAQQAYRNEGLAVFFKGLGVCSVRAFFVNAVQWAVYEWMMHVLLQPISTRESR